MNDKPCAEVLKRACVLKKAGGKKKKETETKKSANEGIAKFFQRR